MILHIDTNVAYLVLIKAHISIAVHLYLRNHPPTKDTTKPKLNITIINIFQTIKHVVTSSEEMEIGGMLLNGQEMVLI